MNRLTKREKVVAVLVEKGKSNSEIADEIIVSRHTVKAHIRSIMKKLNVKNRTALGHVIRNYLD